MNDLGGGIHGEGQASRPADEVVDLIKSKGGTAVPNYGTYVSHFQTATFKIQFVHSLTF